MRLNHDRAAQIARGNRVEMTECVGKRPANRAAQGHIREERRQQAQCHRADADEAERREGVLRVVKALLRLGELALAQGIVGERQFVVPCLQVLGPRHDLRLVVARDNGRKRVHRLMQRVPFGRDILSQTVFFRAARQVGIFFPPCVRCGTHRLGPLHRLRDFGRPEQKGRTIQCQTFARRVKLGIADIDGAGHLVGEGLVQGLIRTAHAGHPENANDQQQCGEKCHRQPNSRLDGDALVQHASSCVGWNERLRAQQKCLCLPAVRRL